MTNEDKAFEIAHDNCTHICLADCSAESYFSSENDCYKAAMQAMQWKDEQIDTILHTVEGCLRSFFESQGNTQESIDNFIDAIKAQINKNLSEWKKPSKD